jgi:Holliday junction resolvase
MGGGGNKAKGSKAERELLDIFTQNSFRAARVAGSGVNDNSPADIIAGKVGKKYCIEAKSTKATSKYISKQQIEDFLIFSDIFGLTPVIALRFNHKGWFFISPSELEDSGKNWVITLEKASQKGERFSQFFEHN